MAVPGSRPRVTREQLAKYVKDGLDSNQMATRAGFSRKAIVNALKRHKFFWRAKYDGDKQGIWFAQDTV